MKTIALKNIIDTWNMMEKLNVIAYKEIDATTVEVAECEYNRIHERSNKLEERRTTWQITSVNGTTWQDATTHSAALSRQHTRERQRDAVH